ncbi:hypothetical protein EOPP23_00890 [Endozoicomonas sp. OPT23]|uniref:hypothetical protein n=1 Tax=Endozoicomonas sp. OPT23 TaxID=2072845 RepID=UPI00129A6F8D|nr:hypothetical protein [Endozoicomonas sp. OPT23]MRI31547.1 hypothetical protein [Endozoicomonas sp. OPT23]
MLSHSSLWKSTRFSLAVVSTVLLSTVSYGKETTVYKQVEKAFNKGEQIEGSLDMGKCTLVRPRKSPRKDDPYSFAFMLNPAQISKIYSKDGNLLKTTYKIRQQDFLMTAMGMPPGIYIREVDISADGSNTVRIKESEWQGLWECPEGAFRFD